MVADEPAANSLEELAGESVENHVDVPAEGPAGKLVETVILAASCDD